MFQDFLGQFFSKLRFRGPQFLLISQKIVPRKVVGGYIEASQIQTNAPKWLKYGLKWSQEDILDVPWFPETILLFKIWVQGSSIFAYRSKMVPRRSRAKASQIQTHYPKRLKYGLKYIRWYQAKTTNKNNIISFKTDSFHSSQFPHLHENILHSSKFVYNKKYTFINIIYKLK